MKSTKALLEFWEEQMKQSHTSSNYFFRKSPSHYHMMLLVMSAHKNDQELSVEELKTKLFKTSRPKSAIIINEACEKGFFYLEKTSIDQRKKFSDEVLWRLYWKGYLENHKSIWIKYKSFKAINFNGTKCLIKAASIRGF